MASFEWLNQVPADQWPGHTHGGYGWHLKARDFLERSQASINTDIRSEFDSWASEQQHRGYNLFEAPSIDGDAAFYIVMAECVIEPGSGPGPDRRL